jgi:hypothetical protein
MPASRVIATVPKKIAAAPASKPVLTSRPVAVAAQPAAVQRPAVIVDYSVLSGLATMPAPAFVTTAAQPNGYVRQTGSVTIDYSVLQ